MAQDKSDLVALYFYADEEDADIVIPIGTYPISHSEEYGTVLANPGVMDGAVYPSYYATLQRDGRLNEPIWMLVSGSVEVSKTEDNKLYLEVNALNSYDVPIHIVYNGAATGVEDITSSEAKGDKVVKILRHGQLLILHDGKTYNVLGESR